MAAAPAVPDGDSESDGDHAHEQQLSKLASILAKRLKAEAAGRG